MENTPERPLEDHVKYIDLTYLTKRTKANPALMLEMIALYLKQTPPLVNEMKQSLIDEDWHRMYTAAHKIIPSFSIMGMNKDFEDTAKQIQDYSSNHRHLDKVKELVLQIEIVCFKACQELEEEFGSSLSNYEIDLKNS